MTTNAAIQAQMLFREQDQERLLEVTRTQALEQALANAQEREAIRLQQLQQQLGGEQADIIPPNQTDQQDPPLVPPLVLNPENRADSENSVTESFKAGELAPQRAANLDPPNTAAMYAMILQLQEKLNAKEKTTITDDLARLDKKPLHRQCYEYDFPSKFPYT
ncbi:hypothetical protein FRX31_030016 [Thalictrum thalictroides]|uniref:Uncharacterized protein n=1 Tax=Thalictrum thalictroides TaxID=46969 RepID=A0A7J6V6L5_THATH|nr:hypothetical protein FRX31_030016 [Thalictrum thalictroides]